MAKNGQPSTVIPPDAAKPTAAMPGNGAEPDPMAYDNAPRNAGLVTSGGSRAAQERQRALGTKKPAARVKLAAFRTAKPLGVQVSYTENKISIMANLDTVIGEIAEAAGISLTDENKSTLFLYALVTDVYTNPYSDKYTFEGDVVVPGLELPRRYIKEAIHPHVGTHYRRYARAMAPVVVAMVRDNPDFHELLDRRALELNIGRAEAIYSFDGADQLTDVNRDINARNAAARTLALTKRRTGAEYSMAGASVATGGHTYGGTATAGDGSTTNTATQAFGAMSGN